MKEQTFKRKRKPIPQQSSAPLSQRSPAATEQAAIRQASEHLGMPYQSGPLYNLAGFYFDCDDDEVAFKDIDALVNQLANPEAGEALDTNRRRGLERRFGRDFSQIRIHSGPVADALTGALHAKAVTHRQHIWLGKQAKASDARLIAHELTHVVQQGYAPRRAAVGLHLGAPAVATPANAHAGRESGRPSAAAAKGAPAGTAGPGAVQRIDLWDTAVSIGGSVASGVGSAVEFVADIPGNIASMALDQLRPLVRRIAPNFYAFFADGGVGGFLNRLVQRGIRSLFTGIMQSIRNVVNLDNLGQGFDQASEWLSAVTEQFTNDACDAILGAARRVRGFFSDTFGPVIEKISSVACEVKTFLSGIWESIGTPIWEFLRNIGGEIWEGLQGFIRDAGRLIREAREALGAGWDRVKGWLGIEAEEGTSEGGGLWSWIRDQVAEIGSSIAELVRPVMGPLRDAAGVLLLLVPGGQIFAVMLLWPRLRQAFDWISEVWNDLNLIPRARTYLRETVFPALMDAAEAVAQALLEHADWLIANLSRFVGTVSGLVESIPQVLMPMRPVVNFMLRLFQRVLGFARRGIRYVSRNFRSLMRRLIDFLGLVLQGLIHLISIALNPFGIVGFLTGSLWRLLPECLKGPFINFILNTIIGFLRLMPPLPQMGILWPLIKSAMLGFLGTVLDLELVRKVNISNKIATIISGMSPTFVFGFFRGIVLGLWEAITGPISAIGMVFELPTMIQEFLSNLGVRLCRLIDQIRCFANELTSRVFGSVDSVLSAIGEFLQEPGRVIELIRCAIEGILSGAQALGSEVATRMIRLFEGPDENIGVGLGRAASFVLVQAAITYFTAGAGTAVATGVGIIRQIATALRTLGRAIREVVRVVRGLFGRLVGFLRGLASKFGRAVAQGGRSVLGRLGGFFRRVANWMRRLLGRMGRAIRRRFMMSPAQRARWIAFKAEVGRITDPQGMTKGRLRGVYRGILRRYRTVAKRPAFITKHGPHWRLWVRKVKGIRPRRVGRVLLDRNRRWRAGGRAIVRAIRRVRAMPGNIGTSEISRLLIPIGRRYHYRGSPRLTFDADKNQFEVYWSMSNTGAAAKVGGEVPARRNLFRPIAPGRKAVLDNFMWRKFPRSDAIGSMGRLERIRAWPTCTTTAYVKGHLIGGYFTHGLPSNWTPISRSANWWMWSRWEQHLQRPVTGMKTRSVIESKIARGKTRRLKIYKMTVEAQGQAGTYPRRIKMSPTSTGCATARTGPARRIGYVRDESRLANTIRFNIVRKKYDPGSRTFREDSSMGLRLPLVPRSASVTNVPNQARYGGSMDTVNRRRGIRGFPGGDIEG